MARVSRKVPFGAKIKYWSSIHGAGIVVASFMMILILLSVVFVDKGFEVVGETDGVLTGAPLEHGVFPRSSWHATEVELEDGRVVLAFTKERMPTVDGKSVSLDIVKHKWIGGAAYLIKDI